MYSSSEIGPDPMIFNEENWKDPIYKKATTQFIVIHFCLFNMLCGLYLTSFMNPGNIPDELKGPDLKASEISQLKKLTVMGEGVNIENITIK